MYETVILHDTVHPYPQSIHINLPRTPSSSFLDLPSIYPSPKSCPFSITNDANLLLHSATDPNATGYGGPINWAGRAKAYRALITQYLGAAGANVQLLATEFNSVSSNPSNQTTSLVNGLWLADALGGIMQTEYNGAIVWDMRNGYDTSHLKSRLRGTPKRPDEAAATPMGNY